MEDKQEINTSTLQSWLENKENVVVLDVRPKEQREEWQIPGSVYIDAYKRLNTNDPSVLDEVTIREGATVVTVCAAGRTSRIAANELRKKGVEAYSLEGGMKAWSTAWNKAEIDFGNFQIVQVRRTGKGCLSYIISSDREAAIVDASLPSEVYQQILAEKNLTLKFILETHIHADHLSRSNILAEKYKLPIYLPVPNKVTFAFEPINDSAIFQLGNINIKAFKTPGHTLESTSFLANNKVLLTGDTLFVDGVGRPDLKADAGESLRKSKLLYQSLQKLLALNDNIIVLPAHTSHPIDFNDKPVQTTLSEVKLNVPMLQMDEESFINTLLQRIPETPANYLAIVERNLKGDSSDVNPIDLEAGANRCAIS